MKYPFTIPEWNKHPINHKLLDEIRSRKYQIYDDIAVDPVKVKSLKIVNAFRRKNNREIRVFYNVWYDLEKEPFESTGLLVYVD